MMSGGKTWLALLFVVTLALAPGCTAWEQLTTGEAPSPSTGGEVNQGGSEAQAPLGRYYDFDDIQVPRSLKLDKEKSILFRVDNFKCGVLVFSENLDAESLINFFVDSMTKDNWVLKSSFKYPKTALFFAKKGKTCIIQIEESAWTTTVSIWVAPSL